MHQSLNPNGVAHTLPQVKGATDVYTLFAKHFVCDPVDIELIDSSKTKHKKEEEVSAPGTKQVKTTATSLEIDHHIIEAISGG